MNKRFYFDKKNGMIIFLCLLGLLPLYIILLHYSAWGIFIGIYFCIFEDVGIISRLFAALYLGLVLLINLGATWFYIFEGKYAYLFLHSVKISDEGVTSSFFSFGRKHWSWNEITECGIAWDFDRIPQNNRPLPDGKEKFVYERDTNKNGIKCIFFSTKGISDTEKLEIFFGQKKKDYLIAVRFSQELYEYLCSTDRLVCKDTLVNKQYQEEEQLQWKYWQMSEQIKLKQFVDNKLGIMNLAVSFLSLIIALLFIVAYCTAIDQYDSLCGNIFECIFMLGGFGMFLVFTVILGRNMLFCFRVITVDSKGLKSKFFLGRETRWGWEEIKECGVIRDNSPRRAKWKKTRKRKKQENQLNEKQTFKDQRYIFFSRGPLYLEKDKDLVKQYKRKDVIFVLYSERLYHYLNVLGVMKE